MLRVLKTSDVDEWTAALAAVPPFMRDVHLSPALLAAHEWGGYRRARLLVLEHSGSVMVQPLLVDNRGIARSAYNFGGPAGELELADEFAVQTANWRMTEGIVEEHCTLNPHCAWEQASLVTHALPVRIKQAVVVDLHKPLQYRPTTRRMVAKAAAGGVVAHVVPPTAENVGMFHMVYAATMERQSAADHWRLPPSFFVEYLSWLHNNAVLVLVTVNDELEAGCIVVHGGDRAYYHWAGTFLNHSGFGVSQYMVDAAAGLARDTLGCGSLMLGGGVTSRDDDSLLLFKSGFSDETLPVVQYIWERKSADAESRQARDHR